MLAYIKKGINIAKKVFLVLVVYTVVVSLFTHFFSKNQPVQTTYDPIQENRKEIYRVINDPELNKSKEGKQIVAIYRLAMCGVMGEGCTDNPNDGEKNFDKSFFGFLTRGITAPYSTPPASGVAWVYEGLQNTGFVPQTYAATGIGFSAIQPIAPLWKIFRDAAIAILVVVLITIGFLIMFRVKINPQTVISLENSLPRIIISLILIVFSFAIAGFLIDMMYVVTAMALSLLGKSADINKMIDGGTGTLWGQIFRMGDIRDLGQALFNLLPNLLQRSLRIMVAGSAYVLALRFTPFGQLLDGQVVLGMPFVEGLIKFIISFTLFLPAFMIFMWAAPQILGLIILVTTGLLIFLRILLLLLKAYIRIIIFTIFAPMFILLTAIPGRNMFFQWLRNLVTDLAAFPLTAIFVVLAGIIANTPTTQGEFWQPPFLSAAKPSAFNLFIGIMILFLIPDFIKQIRSYIGTKPSPINMGVKALFGGAAGGAAAGGIIHKFGSLSYAQHGFQTMKSLITGKSQNPHEEQGQTR